MKTVARAKSQVTVRESAGPERCLGQRYPSDCCRAWDAVCTSFGPDSWVCCFGL